jgi:hypothetical protein
MADTHGGPRQTKTTPAKRPYVPPRLVRYGDAAALTLNRFTGSKNDKGGGFKTRTR